MTTAQPFPRIQIACLEGRAQSVRLRQSLFHSLFSALTASETAIKSAIAAETGGNSDADIDLEYSLALSELRTHYESLDLKTEVKIAHSLESPDGTTSHGIIYIVPAQRNLLYSIVSPLCAALAAGNCVVLELPPTISQVSGVLRKLLLDALDADIFAISDSTPPQPFLSHCHVVAQADEGRSSFHAAASCLSSRSTAMVVAVIDRTANVSDAARSIALSRRFFQGQSHYAPDVVLVSEWVADELLAHLVREVATPLMTMKKMPSVANGHANGHLTKPKQDVRAQTMADFEGQEGAKVVVSGENGSIVEITSRDHEILRRKIEGPVTVFYRISSLDDAIDLSNSLGTSLDAMYVFATSEEATYTSRYIDARVSYINHIPIELLVGPSAPSHPTIPTTATPRYNPAMFCQPQPRLATASNLSKSLLSQNSTSASQVSVQETVYRWSKAFVRPLPPTGQLDGRAVGFFDAAFLLAQGTVLSVVGVSVFFGVRYLRRR